VRQEHARQGRGVDVRVDEVGDVTDDVAHAIGRLLPQLSRSAEALDWDAVANIVGCPTNTVFVARGDGEIIGMSLPSGLRARIEDVVVDERARGLGVGRALTEAAVRTATRHGARTLDLTSRPDRAAANRPYERLGFRPRESTVYRFQVDPTS
jgi:ribosomal protein S18 acetylase RimI-like enzyme